MTKANLLTRGAALEQVKALQAAAPGRFTWFNSYDVTRPDAEQVLTQAVKDGAQGFGEMKFHVAADSPELRRIYALAADLRVPILIHFQEVDHFPNEGTWSTGFAKTFDSVLKAYPKTTFIGHADVFWANVSADYHNEAAYPTGPIKRGGLTDKWLGEYPISSRTWRPIPATTPCREILSSPPVSWSAIRTSCSSAAIAPVPTATVAASARTTTRQPREWRASAWPARR